MANAPNSPRRRARPIVLAIAAALLLLPSQAAAEDPPVITNATLSPSGNLPYTGGTSTVSADVTDDVGLDQVFANVVAQDGGFQAVPMSPAGGNSYSGTITFPTNFTNETFGYQIEVQAIDTELLDATAPAGEVQLDAQPQFDEKPTVGETSVSPRELTAAGGPVALQMHATDDRGISEAYAVFTAPDGGETVVPLDGTGFDNYAGVFNAPPNSSSASRAYSIQFSAIDDIGQQTLVDGGTVTVAGQPAGERLTISPVSWSFGNVKTGHRRQHAFVVRNTGKKGTPAIDGVVTSSGAPFFLVGAKSGGIRVHLAPGQSKKIHVEFRPTATVLSSGLLAVTRGDGGQPGLAAKLSGTGRKK